MFSPGWGWGGGGGFKIMYICTNHTLDINDFTLTLNMLYLTSAEIKSNLSKIIVFVSVFIFH